MQFADVHNAFALTAIKSLDMGTRIFPSFPKDGDFPAVEPEAENHIPPAELLQWDEDYHLIGRFREIDGLFVMG